MPLTLEGIYPAIVTPFLAEGEKIDTASLATLIEHCIAGGVRGLVVAGSTGEAATLSDDEYRDLVQFVRDHVARRAEVIAGIGTNNTRRAVEIAEFLDTQGIDGVLLVTPPYNKPTQEGIKAHFAAVQRATHLPLIAYNVPGRTAVNMLPSTVATLASDRIIAGIKEASGSVDQIMDVISATAVYEPFKVLAGDDSLTLATMACGGTGCISVLANLFPAELVALANHVSNGDLPAARRLQLGLLPITRALFAEANPIPVKWALAERGIIAHPTTRLPLTPASKETVSQITQAIPPAL